MLVKMYRASIVPEIRPRHFRLRAQTVESTNLRQSRPPSKGRDSSSKRVSSASSKGSKVSRKVSAEETRASRASAKKRFSPSKPKLPPHKIRRTTSSKPSEKVTKSMQKTTTEKHIPSPPSQGEGSVAVVHSEPSVENPTIAEHIVTITDQEMQNNSRIVDHVESIELDTDEVFEQGTENLPEQYTYFGHVVYSVSFGLCM